MITVKTTFEIKALSAFEIDSSDNYYILDESGKLSHPAEFHVYEIPDEVLLFHKLEKDVDLGTVESIQEFNEKIHKLLKKLEKKEQ